MIYFFYYLSVLMMFCMLLNFMVGVIDMAYEKVADVEQIHINKNKAELNAEYFEMVDIFYKFD